MKILVSDKISNIGIDYLKQNGFEVLYTPDIIPTDLLDVVKDADALIVRSRSKVTAEVIAAGKNLKVIARVGSGIDNIDVAAAKKQNIVIVNAPGVNSESVAEHTMALMLSLVRTIPDTMYKTKQGLWPKKEYKAIELMGKTLGIIGFGHIGMRVARLAKGFGMQIVVYNRTTTGDKQIELEKLGGKFVVLNTLLQTADIVTLHVAKSPETVKLIGSEQLKLMKKTAYLINCSRGEVVDEAALIAALQSKTIAGAALDVYTTEPLSIDNPLLKLDNVMMTPHVAATSVEAGERAAMMVVADVAKVLKGEKAEHEV